MLSDTNGGTRKHAAPVMSVRSATAANAFGRQAHMNSAVLQLNFLARLLVQPFSLVAQQEGALSLKRSLCI